MLLQDPTEKLFKECADAIRTKFGLDNYNSEDKVTWRRMFAYLYFNGTPPYADGFDDSYVDNWVDAPSPLENYLSDMSIQQRLQYTLGQVCCGIRYCYDPVNYGSGFIGASKSSKDRIELQDIPYHIINGWSSGGTPDETKVNFTISGTLYSVTSGTTWATFGANNGLTQGGSGQDAYVAHPDKGPICTSDGFYVNPSATITSGTYYWIVDVPYNPPGGGGGDTPVVSFYINGTPFYDIINGNNQKTWRALSQTNTNFSLGPDYVAYSGAGIVYKSSGQQVSPDDFIIYGHYYIAGD